MRGRASCTRDRGAVAAGPCGGTAARSRRTRRLVHAAPGAPSCPAPTPLAKPRLHYLPAAAGGDRGHAPAPGLHGGRKDGQGAGARRLCTGYHALCTMCCGAHAPSRCSYTAVCGASARAVVPKGACCTCPFMHTAPRTRAACPPPPPGVRVALRARRRRRRAAIQADRAAAQGRPEIPQPRHRRQQGRPDLAPRGGPRLGRGRGRGRERQRRRRRQDRGRRGGAVRGWRQRGVAQAGGDGVLGVRG